MRYQIAYQLVRELEDKMLDSLETLPGDSYTWLRYTVFNNIILTLCEKCCCLNIYTSFWNKYNLDLSHILKLSHFSKAWRNVIVHCTGIHWIRKVDLLRSDCGSKTVTMTTFPYQWYVSHRSCILVSVYTRLFSQSYWGRLERPCVIPSKPAMFSGGVAPGCLLNPGLSKVTAGFGLPRSGSG